MWAPQPMGIEPYTQPADDQNPVPCVQTCLHSFYIQTDFTIFTQNKFLMISHTSYQDVIHLKASRSNICSYRRIYLFGKTKFHTWTISGYWFISSCISMPYCKLKNASCNCHCHSWNPIWFMSRGCYAPPQPPQKRSAKADQHKHRVLSVPLAPLAGSQPAVNECFLS